MRIWDVTAVAPWVLGHTANSDKFRVLALQNTLGSQHTSHSPVARTDPPREEGQGARQAAASNINRGGHNKAHRGEGKKCMQPLRCMTYGPALQSMHFGAASHAAVHPVTAKGSAR